jgi:hypothetical protein
MDAKTQCGIDQETENHPKSHQPKALHRDLSLLKPDGFRRGGLSEADLADLIQDNKPGPWRASRGFF